LSESVKGDSMSQYHIFRKSNNWNLIAFKRPNGKQWVEIEQDIIIQARQDYDRGHIDMSQKKTSDGFTHLLIKKTQDMMNKPKKRKPYFGKGQ
tara:strand:+ start:645 stop:923 length:279 start_codon:yes stop_codon:yes gene_type:complete